ncbi:transmembrane prolyl 4-hydroxylase-like isoform X2 [Apostichopus japonicus]|uniref:transmembrane prolyl 4-hydroxylase-like isoform X2 n=1 Tax=Stichopus japonicus TaxID=307972 RepID=UPI003AB7A94C
MIECVNCSELRAAADAAITMATKSRASLCYVWLAFFLVSVLLQLLLHGVSADQETKTLGENFLGRKEATVVDNLIEDEPTNKSQRMKIFQHDPVAVGHIRKIEIEGQYYEMKTVALKPPIFVIPNFLSDEECDAIIDLSLEQGLEKSATQRKVYKKRMDADDVMAELFTETDVDGDGKLNMTEMAPFMLRYFEVELNYDELSFLLTETVVDLDSNKSLDPEEFSLIPGAEIYIRRLTRALKMRPLPTNILKKLRKGSDRKSCQTRLEHDLYDPEGMLRNRVAALTGIQKEIVYSSELLHVVQYNRSGHYHAHKDSQPLDNESVCKHSDHLYPNSSDGQPPKSRLCRFMTVLYYLTEPERGGQTAFPVADNETFTEEGIDHFYRIKHHDIYDLTNHCHDSNLVVEPRKGTAIMWYNHNLDDQNEWIGDINKFSLHGGCEVIKGEKWIANHWINIDDNYDMQMAYLADRIRNGSPPEDESTHRRPTNDTNVSSIDDARRSTCQLPQDWSNTASMTSHDEL